MSIQKDNNSSDEELTFLNNWNLFILDYLIKITGSAMLSLLEEFKAALQNTYESGDLKRMRTGTKTIVKFAKFLDVQQLHELNQELKKEFGHTLDSYNNSIGRIKAIVKKGEIKNAKEYQLLFDYFEEHYNDENKTLEMELINGLLSEYQKKTGKV